MRWVRVQRFSINLRGAAAERQRQHLVAGADPAATAAQGL